MEQFSLEERAQSLLRKAVHECQNSIQSSHTLAIYDTAWVAMIVKTVNNEPRWAFPESFRFILEEQESDGGWNRSENSDDGILNTLAALLAMKRHETSTNVAVHITDTDLSARLSNATIYLERKLQQWNVGASVHVGFEILVPTLLSMLEQEQLIIQFPQKEILMRLNAQKLRRFDPSMLYGNEKHTFLHSLEAFVGKVDFDKIQHHKLNGSFMYSPSSTAAYLMSSSTWDDESEMYIRDAIRHGRGHGNGGVPSVFPSNIFELTWVTSTLLQAGYTEEALDRRNVKDIVSYLERHSRAQEGLLGFAPSVLADVDDSARAVITLNQLGQPTSPEKLLSFLEAGEAHLTTYHGERDSSFSANCNGLMAILHAPDSNKYLPHIENITDFLCTSYLSGLIKDKWNTSPQYSMMLLAQTLMRLIQLWGDGPLELLPQHLVQDQVIPALVQVLNRTLLTQHTNGGWSVNNVSEVNAYSILTLLALQDLPQAKPLAFKIQSAIHAGRQVLAQTERQWGKPAYLWIEKVTYGSSVLAETYCLAAMNAPLRHFIWSDKVEKTVTTTATEVISLSGFFHRMPDYSDISEWKVLASVIEGSLYLRKLKIFRYEIFPRQQSSEDKYLDYIPCSWIIVNNCKGLLLDSTLMWDMMVMTMLDFLVDEYMESVVAQLQESDIMSLQQIIRTLCLRPGIDSLGEPALPHQDSHFTSYSRGPGNETSPGQPKNGYLGPLAAVNNVIGTYVKAVTENPRIQNASVADQFWLKAELETFLLSHIEQIKDNQRFRRQVSCSLDAAKRFQNPRTSHYVWSHTTAANHTSCAVSLAFYTCRLSWNSTRGVDVFYTSYLKYIVGDLCSHLAVMSRLYNDYASIARDHAESNLNSINFPEFCSEQKDDATHASPPNTGEVRARNSLLGLAYYERMCVKTSFQTLVEALGETTATAAKLRDALTLFIGVADLFANMYVVKDLTNRVR